MKLPQEIKPDPWQSLRQFTPARIALGNTGVSIPVKENLQFKMAHAFARDAVYASMDKENLFERLQKIHHPVYLLHSKAIDRHQYIQRPDLGKRLDETSLQLILSEPNPIGYDICINIADGLSATAVDRNVLPLLHLLIPLLKDNGFSISPICVIEQGRVAVSDETGSCLKAKLSLILLGERPGLSSRDSLGAYLTFHPEIGNTDEMRNCISNIRPQGLSYRDAAEKMIYLIKESFRLKFSGVRLKDLSDLPGLIDE